jgi:hypothetical protein
MAFLIWITKPVLMWSFSASGRLRSANTLTDLHLHKGRVANNSGFKIFVLFVRN